MFPESSQKFPEASHMFLEPSHKFPESRKMFPASSQMFLNGTGSGDIKERFRRVHYLEDGTSLEAAPCQGHPGLLSQLPCTPNQCEV
jgi:hypothetical protein